MALSFAEPVSADFSLREFAARGEENPDGWGLAWYPDGGRSASLIKEPVRWASSPTAGFLSDSPTLTSRVYLAHVRHKTVGGVPNHADTHPFLRELGGRDVAFAHNGTLEGGAWDLPLGRFRPLGQTDSERFFCHLLAEVEARTPLGAPLLADRAAWGWLHATLADANRFGKLNVLLTDGTRLFVYHDQNAWKGLNFRRTLLHPGRERQFGDDDLAVHLAGTAGVEADGASRPNVGFAVATCPLSPTGWHKFEVGELLVFERGRLVFSSHRDPVEWDHLATAARSGRDRDRISA